MSRQPCRASVSWNLISCAVSVMSLSSPVGRLKKFLAWRIMKSRDLVNATTPKMKHSNSSTVMMLSLAVL